MKVPYPTPTSEPFFSCINEQEAYEERAAIYEYEAGLSRDEAEEQALKDLSASFRRS